MRRKQIVDYLVYVVVRILICIVQAMRIETGQRLARGLAWLFCDVLHIRSRVVDDNLAMPFPKCRRPSGLRLARRMWEHLFLLVLEVAHTPRKIHETNWRDFVTLKNEADLVRDLLDDRPLLIVCGALGQFRGGRLRAGHSWVSHVHGRPHARQSVSRPLREPLSRRHGPAHHSEERRLRPDRRGAWPAAAR